MKIMYLKTMFICIFISVICINTDMYMFNYVCLYVTHLFMTFENGAFKCVCAGISCNIAKYFKIAAIV